MIFVDLQYMDNTVPDVILFYFIFNFECAGSSSSYAWICQYATIR